MLVRIKCAVSTSIPAAMRAERLNKIRQTAGRMPEYRRVRIAIVGRYQGNLGMCAMEVGYAFRLRVGLLRVVIGSRADSSILWQPPYRCLQHVGGIPEKEHAAPPKFEEYPLRSGSMAG